MRTRRNIPSHDPFEGVARLPVRSGSSATSPTLRFVRLLTEATRRLRCLLESVAFHKDTHGCPYDSVRGQTHLETV